MANPSCIVESGKLSPVGLRNLALFQAQSDKRMLVILMADEHLQSGYFGPNPSPTEPTAWMLPFLAAGIPVSASIGTLRSDTKVAIILTAAAWALRRNVGRYKDNIFQVWGDGTPTKTWPVMPTDETPAPPR